MITIKKIEAMEILDSRGNPTVETTVHTSDGQSVSASVPSGASIGKHEAVELRDNDVARYNGMGVLNAVENVNATLGPELTGMDVVKQGIIDKKMIEIDGTANKSRLGSNAILAVSIAVAKAAANGDQEFLDYVAKALVDNPDAVEVDRKVDEMGVLLTIKVHKDDVGKLIGRNGNTAKALRTLLRVVGMKNHARVNLKIDEPEGGRAPRENSVESMVDDLKI